MCVFSNVIDHYKPYFDPWTAQPSTPYEKLVPLTPEQLPMPGTPDNEELKRLIEEFKRTVEAAKLVDKNIGQPDCEDPAKATLLDRVADLERRLGALEKLVGAP